MRTKNRACPNLHSKCREIRQSLAASSPNMRRLRHICILVNFSAEGEFPKRLGIR